MKKFRLPILVVAVSFCMSTSVFGQEHASIIKNYIESQKKTEFRKNDLKNFMVDVVDESPSLKGTVVKFQQTYNGLPIYASVGTALLKNNDVTYFQEDFVKDYVSAASATPSLTSAVALSKIAAELAKPEITEYPMVGFFDPNVEGKPTVKQRLVYFADADNKLVLAHEFTLPEPNSSNYWNYLVDGHTGKILTKVNMTNFCTFHDDAYDREYTGGLNFHEHKVMEGPINRIGNSNFSLRVADNASYNVFPFPVESPLYGSRALVSNPWDLIASPDGWHYDGTEHFTYTRGNNVHTYEDTAGTNMVGYSPDGGVARVFDYPYDYFTDQWGNFESAITNLFYANNRVHDIFYRFGFKENTRNFQKKNYVTGGYGNDYVLAEAQDGSGTNNANFSSPQDGTNGRMQMYMWSPTNRTLSFNSPSSVKYKYPIATSALYGVILNPSVAPVNGDLVIPAQEDGCSIPAGTMTDKIALIRKGGACTPPQKTKNAQLAGAKGVIIYDDVEATGSPVLIGSDATITIPTVSVRKFYGEHVKAIINGGETVNATIGIRQTHPDSDFDNGVIAHEYGHGVSNRMTGQGYSCLSVSNSNEQMGEGWSDFFALMFTNKPGDDASVARGIANYVNKDDISGVGIRPARYSPDFAVNDYTYGDTNGLVVYSNGQTIPHQHSIGFIWASMLWDLHWNYVDKYGYASDVVANPTSGSGRVLQLVMDALKLQPCSPTFINGRDAILAADQATTGGADKCMIWRTFARRGLGVNASAGSKTSINDQIEDFTVPTECALATEEVNVAAATNAMSLYPNPAKDEFFIHFPSKVAGVVSVEITDASGKLVKSIEKVSVANKDAISTAGLTNGVYFVKVKGLGLEAASKLVIKK